MNNNTTNTVDQGKINIVGPDYGQMMQKQTNLAIVEAFITQLFSKDIKFDVRTIFSMIRNMIILVIIKTVLEESKTYFDKFKFTNLNIFKYFYQRLRYSESCYYLELRDQKWYYGNKTISINTLKPFLEQRSIYVSQPGTYYYSNSTYLIKIIITPYKITWCVPDIDVANRYIITEIISKNEEIVHGGKTIMGKVVISQSGVIKIEPIQLAYAFATDNYLKLQESIKNNIWVDAIMKFPTIPVCVNFDGEPGTGKTTFGSYIASTGIFDRIIIFNLIQAANLSFNETISNLERIITNSSKDSSVKDNSVKDNTPKETELILLILDEIDKWLDSYICNNISKLREDSRSKKQVKKDASSPEVTIESFEKLSIAEEEDKRKQIKNEFLDQLYKLVDGHILPDTRKYVIIFNTNNFDKLFENVDKRYVALSDRFQKYKFMKNGKPEIISYINNLRDQLQSHISKFPNGDKKTLLEQTCSQICSYDDNIFESIPDNISISYRTLLKTLRKHCFNIPACIAALSDPNMENLENFTTSTPTLTKCIENVNKEYNKEVNKEANKEINKEANKEVNKEANKEANKDSILEV